MRIFLAILFLFSAPVVCAASPQVVDTVLRSATIVDVERGVLLRQYVVVVHSGKILAAVEKSLSKQIKLSKRPKELAAALKNAALVLVEDMDSAVRLTNAYAAEHVSIAAASPGQIALQLTTSGALFLGGISPVVGGDFLAGPSHELPTSGAGKSFAGLTADQFQRRTSVVMFDEPSLRASLPYLQTFSEIEGLDAHGRSARIRLEK